MPLLQEHSRKIRFGKPVFPQQSTFAILVFVSLALFFAPFLHFFSMLPIISTSSFELFGCPFPVAFLVIRFPIFGISIGHFICDNAPLPNLRR